MSGADDEERCLGMALDSKTEAAIALHRFGLGPRPGSVNALASDPRGALLAELDRAGAGRIDNPDLLSHGAATRAAFAFQEARRQQRREKDAQKNAAQKDAAPKAGAPPAPTAATPGAGIAPQQLYLTEAKARLGAALGARIGFAERLAWFWSNHFCVSADKGGVRPIAGAFEREAIRAHLLGRFGDMLQAVESHPAMLLYLDNARSIGPNSIAGRNRGRGLNENLAREILELHTLGVRTVYTQDDVTNFAKVITGWSIIPPRQDPVRGGEFTFNPRMHEPGTQTVVGQSYADAGFDQGRRVLADLSRHPATANGFGDEEATWIDGLSQRLDVANQVVRRIGTDIDPKAVFEETLAPIASAETKQTITRADSRPQALALLLMPPKFRGGAPPAPRRRAEPGEMKR